MEPVNILDARNTLSQLVTAAGNGEDVVIAKRGTPVVRLVPVVTAEGVVHSASAAARWLTTNAAPVREAASSADLDERIARERADWE
ncbi:MAG: type II toxin-antitoxin system prevent-host-death family antitoxin [Pseudolysinimonas sp.]